MGQAAHKCSRWDRTCTFCAALQLLRKFHCYMPNTTTRQEAKPPTLEGAPRRAQGCLDSMSASAAHAVELVPGIVGRERRGSRKSARRLGAAAQVMCGSIRTG